MKAYLKNYRQSPRKVRLLASFVRGKEVGRALAEISYLSKRAALPMKKLIESAVANAKENFDMEQKDLIVKDITVDQGFTLKRHRPRAFGRAAGINKRTSNIAVVLSKKEQQKEQNTRNKKQTETKNVEKRNETEIAKEIEKSGTKKKTNNLKPKS